MVSTACPACRDGWTDGQRGAVSLSRDQNVVWVSCSIAHATWVRITYYYLGTYPSISRAEEKLLLLLRDLCLLDYSGLEWEAVSYKK